MEELSPIEKETANSTLHPFIIRPRNIIFTPKEGTLFDIIQQASELVRQDDGAGRKISEFELHPQDKPQREGLGANVEVRYFTDTLEQDIDNFLWSCNVSIGHVMPQEWTASAEYLGETLSKFGGEFGIDLILERGKSNIYLSLYSTKTVDQIPFWQDFAQELVRRKTIGEKAKLIAALGLIPLYLPFVGMSALKNYFGQTEKPLPSAHLSSNGQMNAEEARDLIAILDILGVTYEHTEAQLHVLKKQPQYSATLNAQRAVYRQAKSMGFNVWLTSHRRHGEVHVGEYSGKHNTKIMDLSITIGSEYLQPVAREEIVRLQKYVERYVSFKGPWVIHTYTVDKPPSDSPLERSNTIDIITKA